MEIDEALVHRLLAEQHPDLAPLPLSYVDTGWDNAIWRVGDELAVRLPVRAVAVPLVANEQRWLPELAPGLPLPVPAPVRTGVPSAAFGWPWSVVPWLGGAPGDRTPATDGPTSAERLGRFLGALHRPAPPDAPANPWRGVPLGQRADTFAERLRALAAHVDAPVLQAVWEDAMDAPAFDGAPLWLHGDLHGGNVLVEDGALAAVVDFGDVCAGDPATDLAAGFGLLPSGSWLAFAAAYGPVTDDLLRRARGWAVLFGLLEIGIGLEDPPSYLAMGMRTIERVIDSVRR